MLRILLILILMTSPALAITQWNKAIPAAGDSKSAWPTAVTAQWAVLDTLLANYRKGMAVVYKNATTLTVSSGEVTASNSGGSLRLMLQNTSNTDITSANIDVGGSFGNSTTYYVYAGTSSSTASAATYYISANSSAPSGVTYYKALGSFTTDGSANILSYSVNEEPFGTTKADSTGVPIKGVTVYSYGSSQSSSTNQSGVPLKVAFGTVSIPPGAATISNLPFTSTSSYGISCSQADGAYNEGGHCNISSASAFTITNDHNDTRSYNWTALGY